MSSIAQYLQSVRTSILARTVRNDIANAIEQCYDDVNSPTLQTEALESALQKKINQGEMAALTIGDGTITKAKLDPNISFEKMNATVVGESLILTIE